MPGEQYIVVVHINKLKQKIWFDLIWFDLFLHLIKINVKCIDRITVIRRYGYVQCTSMNHWLSMIDYEFRSWWPIYGSMSDNMNWMLRMENSKERYSAIWRLLFTVQWIVWMCVYLYLAEIKYERTSKTSESGDRIISDNIQNYIFEQKYHL